MTKKVPTTSSRTVARAIAVACAASAVAAGVVLVEAASAEAGELTVVEGYRTTLSPLQSVGLPVLACPAGTYLYRANYSPGRLVPGGVQVVESGGVGVSMGGASLAVVQPTGLPVGVQVYDQTAAPASATNWNLSSREVVINLVCTTNPWNALYDDPYHVRD